MIQGLHHTSFTISNVEEAERFFVDLFGMERIGGGVYDFDYIRRTVAFADAVLKISVLAFPEKGGVRPPHLLELIEYTKSSGKPTDTATNRPGNAHLCFQVDDIDAEYTRLSERGVRFKSTPNEVTWGINKGARGVYFNGPDGIAMELLQPAARQK
jgi:catechol 2,3-dioxygenase-like lactoylglutathione lyase family enzyme